MQQSRSIYSRVVVDINICIWLSIFQDADLKVFVGSTLKTLTHYTVTGAGTTSGGNVVMTTGNAVTNADVTIVRDIELPGQLTFLLQVHFRLIV